MGSFSEQKRSDIMNRKEAQSLLKEFQAVSCPCFGGMMREKVDSSRNRVLVAHHNLRIRKPIVHALKESGFRVLEAKNGFQAFDVLTAHHKQVDAFICDNRMIFVFNVGIIEALINADKLVPSLLIYDGESEGTVPKEYQSILASGMIEFIRWPCDVDIVVKRTASLFHSRVTVGIDRLSGDVKDVV